MFHDGDQPTPRDEVSDERMERLRKQCAALPGNLSIDDEELIRELAAAGAGGSY